MSLSPEKAGGTNLTVNSNASPLRPSNDGNNWEAVGKQDSDRDDHPFFSKKK